MLAVNIHTEVVLPSESEGIYNSFYVYLKLSAMLPCSNKKLVFYQKFDHPTTPV